MALREITQFSADYSYLDSASIEFLQSRFRGASAVVNAQGATKTVPIEALQPLNRLEAIIDLPPAPGLSPLDADTAQTLQKRGMLEFLVSARPRPRRRPRLTRIKGLPRRWNPPARPTRRGSTRRARSWTKWSWPRIAARNPRA